MTQENVPELLQKAQQALQIGDKKTAGNLINKILLIDFTNEQAWQYLHEMFDKNTPFETFKIQFAQKYYPSKVNLLPQTQIYNSQKPVATSTTQPRLTKKCPYCAEEILENAIVCRFCGRDLNNNSIQAPNERRKTLSIKLIELEKNLLKEERLLQEWQQVLQKETNATNWSVVWFIIGLFLTAAIIGFFIAFFAADQYIRRNRKRRQASEQLTAIRRKIENLQQMIAEIKIELTTLS